MKRTSEFDEYIPQGEPEQREKIWAWRTAIGLQAVDDLKPSEYLIRTAKEHIDGDITFDEVKDRLDSYYKETSDRTDDRTEEADKVSARIAEIISDNTFSFSPTEYIKIHGWLFSGIYGFSGRIRDYNITKAEWVLDGRTVYYANAGSIRETLEYDFKQEKAFIYKGLSERDATEHIAKFISNIWQVHAFGEGNTRTTAVFAIRYLRSFGFDLYNYMFERHSRYFRNALVRANYNDFKDKIYATHEYLDRFFANMLLGEKNVLRNRDLHIRHAGKNGTTSDDGQIGMNIGTNIGTNSGINETQGNIVDLMTRSPEITAKLISETIGISQRQVESNIADLRSKGSIERKGANKNGQWVVVRPRP